MDVLMSQMPRFLAAIWVTLWMFAVITVIATLFGLGAAVLGERRGGGFSRALSVYTWIFRGLPELVVLLFCYLALPHLGVDLGAEGSALLAFSLIGTAFMAEIFRAALRSVDPRLVETARAFGRCNYAYHLHGQAYAQALKALALRMGVKVTSARGFDAVLDPDSGLIRALALSDGRQVAGDFFIDATGGESRLLGQALQGAFIDWSRWLPMNRTLSAGGDRLRVLPAYSQVRALEAGCLHMTALQTMTGVTHAYSGDWLSDEQALEALNVTAGIGLSGDATLSVRAPGRRERLWSRNCVAIGEAGCVLNPIDNPDLHVLQIGLSHLIALFPLAVEGGVEAAQYNRLVVGAYERLRDYQIAHYGLNRQNHPFWDALRDIAPPDSLAAKLDLYKARGEVLLYEDETFQNDDWLSLFIGHGLMPDAWDPRIDMLPEDQLILHVQKLLGFIRDQVQAMDSHDAYIELFAARSFAGFGSQL